MSRARWCSYGFRGLDDLPTAFGTRLSLVQSGFKPTQKREFGGARCGWKLMGGKLVDLLARIPGTSSLLFTGLYLFVLPYVTKWRSGRRTAQVGG